MLLWEKGEERQRFYAVQQKCYPSTAFYLGLIRIEHSLFIESLEQLGAHKSGKELRGISITTEITDESFTIKCWHILRSCSRLGKSISKHAEVSSFLLSS